MKNKTKRKSSLKQDKTPNLLHSDLNLGMFNTIKCLYIILVRPLFRGYIRNWGWKWVRFLGELETLQFPFEIFWQLKWTFHKKIEWTLIFTAELMVTKMEKKYLITKSTRKLMVNIVGKKNIALLKRIPTHCDPLPFQGSFLR